MRPKHCFFIHSATAFVALPSSWPVPMTCCSYGVKDSKSLAGISCFLRPREWFYLGTEHLLFLLRISLQLTRQTVQPTWSSDALALRMLLSAFPFFLYEETQPNQRNKENCVKKILLVKRERHRNSLISRCWSKHQTPWCKRLKLEWKINFLTRQTFLSFSYVNSNFILSTFNAGCDWKCGINQKLKFAFMRSAFHRVS